MDMQPFRKEISEYYEFNLADFLEEVDQQQLAIIAEHTEQAPAERDTATRELIQRSNTMLEAQGLMGADAIFGEGGNIPSRQDNGTIHRHDVDTPIIGFYQGLGISTETFVDPKGDIVFDLSLPTIVHRIFNTRASYGIDEATGEQHCATLPITATTPEIFAQNIAASLPNQRWLKGLANRLEADPTGYDFKEIQRTFRSIADAKYSKVPAQLNMDWFIDHMNATLGIMGKDIEVGAQSAGVHPEDSQQIHYMLAGNDEVSYTRGKCLGFGIIVSFQKGMQEGVPMIMLIEDQPDIALVMEIILDGGPAIVKYPLQDIDAVRAPQVTRSDNV